MCGRNSQCPGWKSRAKVYTLKPLSPFAKKAHADGLSLQWAKELQKIVFPQPETLSKLSQIEKVCPNFIDNLKF